MKLAQPMTIAATYLDAIKLLLPTAVIAIEGQEPDEGLFPSIVISSDGTQLLEWNFAGDPLTEVQVRAAAEDNRVGCIRAHQQQLLDDAQRVALRFYMTGEAYPQDWSDYVKAVKAMDSQPAGTTWPDAPAIPDGV